MIEDSRRWFMASGSVTLGAMLARANAPTSGNAAEAEAVVKGRRFLADLFDPALDLLPEYRDAKIFWLYHDNYLAAKVLNETHPKLAEKIRKSIRSFGVEHSGKIEIIFGEAKQPLPFRQYKLNEVARIGDKVIRTEVVQEGVFLGWRDYADLLFLAALAETNPANARQYLSDGLRLWDGIGFNDQVVRKNHLYATYKLALSLIAAKNLNVAPDARAAILKQLLSVQRQDGGWVTDYDAKGTMVGMANVETTCLAILALNSVS